MNQITRGFHPRATDRRSNRLPPGQHITSAFPVLTAGAIPRTVAHAWTFSLETEAGENIHSWHWDDFRALSHTEVTVDIHCVTRWSKFDTVWRGVTIDTLLAAAGLDEPPSRFVTALCDGGYTTNLPAEDLVNGRALVVWEYDGEPLPPEHGGPARLLVPHLYFWKSAKWIRGLRFTENDEPGFWEVSGYHIYGDPWLEQRYDDDYRSATISVAVWAVSDVRTVRTAHRTLGAAIDSYACGPDEFVEAAASLLLEAGVTHVLIRTERFGPFAV